MGRAEPHLGRAGLQRPVLVWLGSPRLSHSLFKICHPRRLWARPRPSRPCPLSPRHSYDSQAAPARQTWTHSASVRRGGLRVGSCESFVCPAPPGGSTPHCRAVPSGTEWWRETRVPSLSPRGHRSGRRVRNRRGRQALPSVSSPGLPCGPEVTEGLPIPGRHVRRLQESPAAALRRRGRLSGPRTAARPPGAPATPLRERRCLSRRLALTSTLVTDTHTHTHAHARVSPKVAVLLPDPQPGPLSLAHGPQVLARR